MKNHSTVEIPVFQNLGTGRWYYSFNHKQEIFKDDEGNDNVVFSSDTVVMSGEPSEEKIKQAMTSKVTDKGDVNPIIYKETEAPVTEDVGLVVSYTNDVYRSVTREDVEGLEWISNEVVQEGQSRDFYGKTWECIQYHITQLGWGPDKTPALWKEVYTGDSYPVWKQPTGAHDVYMKGDIVWYPELDTTLYRSVIDNNSWSPTAYPAGWEVYTP